MDDTGQHSHAHLDTLRETLPDIPATPGVYLFKDDAGRVVYVGKAKHLRKRVATYFLSPERQTAKTRAMLAQARKVDTLCTGTEKEALLLEASLIKKHRPRYNIVLRDDKQYILFKLDKKVPFPRLVLTRKVLRDGARYFGPFTSAQAARATWKAIHRAFPLRRCTDRALKNRVRPCLYHHIGQCWAPCVQDISQEDYAGLVKQVEMLLMGRSSELTTLLQTEMQRASDALEFEKAAELRDQLRAIERTVEQQAAVLPKASDMDVIGLSQTSTGLALGLLFIRQGRLIDGRSFFWPALSLEEGREVLEGFIGQYYGPQRFIPERVVLPWDLDELARQEAGATALEDANDWGGDCTEDKGRDLCVHDLLAEALSEHRQGRVRVSAPRDAAENHLVSLAAANAREAAHIREQTPLLESLQKALRLTRPPVRMEAVDVSHHGGSQTRVGVVVFEEAEPRKEQYRVYTLPEDVPGGDDYAALSAWAQRRVESGPPWPDLLLVDGGRGQLAAVEKGLELADSAGLFPIAGIAKEKVGKGSAARRKTHGLQDSIFLPGRKNPLPLQPGSPELLFLQHVRDTVHSFAIGRHRRAKRTAALSSELQRLPGVGSKTARLLWDNFPSLEAMAEASEEELAAIPGLGKKKAAALHKELKKLSGRR